MVDPQRARRHPAFRHYSLATSNTTATMWHSYHIPSVAGDGFLVCDWTTAPHGQPVCRTSSAAPLSGSSPSSDLLVVGHQLNLLLICLLDRIHSLLSLDISHRHFLRLYTSGVALSKHPSLKLHHRCVSSLRTISSNPSTALKC